MGYGVEHNLLVWVSSKCLYKVDLLTNKHFAEKHRLKKPFEPLSEKLSKKQRTLPNKLFTSLLLIYLCFSKACMKPTHTLGVRGGQQTKFSFFDFTRFFRISWTLYFYYYCYYYYFFFFSGHLLGVLASVRTVFTQLLTFSNHSGSRFSLDYIPSKRHDLFGHLISM